MDAIAINENSHKKIYNLNLKIDSLDQHGWRNTLSAVRYPDLPNKDITTTVSNPARELN